MNRLRKIIREEVRRVLETHISSDIPMPDDKGRSNTGDKMPGTSEDRIPSDIPEEIVHGMEPEWYEAYSTLKRNNVKSGDLISLFSRLIDTDKSYQREAEDWFKQNKRQYPFLRDIGKEKFVEMISLY